MIRRTRRKLTVENSHDIYRNASNIYMAMTWANEHYTICPQCRRQFERMNRPEAIQRQIEKRRAREVGG